ncbi:HTTM domain-containing protein [Halomontanus rarus]|uniref:HTTM domain-containing protein n=1 Tax=Halomontanus rarus TaxID=3034020 RepID=UPI0023E78078|nr:HTTM domain-containing protein [Halovivax sp. TS33]
MNDDNAHASRAARVRDRTRVALERRLGIDPRALAAFRIALALVLLFDLVHRASDLVVFYTDDGAFPRELLFEYSASTGRYSLHALSGAAWVQALLFLTAGVLAFSLLVGYRTRLVTVLSMVMLASVQFRNPLVLNGADRFLWELLVLAVFLPLGTRWAIDARRTDGSDGDEDRTETKTERTADRSAGDRNENRRIAIPATAAYLVYVVGFFLSNAQIKLRGDRWTGGEALQYALRQDDVTILLGNHLQNYPLFLEVGTYGWFGLVLCSPLLLVFADRLRLAYLVLFLGAVAGMAVSMAVGLFPFVLATALLPFLPPRVWDALERIGSSVARSVPAFANLHERIPRGNGRRVLPEIPESIRHRHRQLWAVIGGCVLIFIVLWVVGLLGFADTFEPVDSVNPEENRWGMYAPDPSESYGWYVVAVDLENDERVDALHRSELRTTPPSDAAEAIPSFRWRQYLYEVRTNDEIAAQFTEYVCQSAEAHYEAPATQVNVTYVQQSISLEEETEPYEFDVTDRSCSDSPRVATDRSPPERPATATGTLN